MRRALILLIALGCAAAMSAGSLYVLELKGGARVFSLDRPVEKGRVLVFHRHPDGVFTSIATAEVVKIAPASAADRTEKFQPGDLMVLGHDVEGPVPESGAPSLAPPPSGAAYSMPAAGYGGYTMYGSYGPVAHRSAPPRAHAPLVPTNIGPNGFPIIAPRGTPGFTAPPIGSNGFPDIAPRREH